MHILQVGKQIAAMYNSTIPGSSPDVYEMIRAVERAGYLCPGNAMMYEWLPMKVMPCAHVQHHAIFECSMSVTHFILSGQCDHLTVI